MTEPGASPQPPPAAYEGIAQHEAPPAYSSQQFQMQQNIPSAYVPQQNQANPIACQPAASPQPQSYEQSQFIQQQVQQPAMYQQPQPIQYSHIQQPIQQQFQPSQQFQSQPQCAPDGYPGQQRYIQPPQQQIQVVIPPNASQLYVYPPQQNQQIVMQNEESFICLYIFSCVSCLLCCPIGIGALLCAAKAHDEYSSGNVIMSNRWKIRARVTAVVAFVIFLLWAILNSAAYR